MASAHSDQNGDCSNDWSFKQLLPKECDDFEKPEILPQIPLDFSGACDKFGEPDILPRIGDAYQTDIPPLIKSSNYIFYPRNTIDLENKASRDMFFIGLPLPLTWISHSNCEGFKSHCSARNISGFRHVIKTETYSDDQNLQISSNEPSHIPWKPFGDSDGKIHKCRGQGCLLVPETSSEYWSGDEKASFLLGLYIFEKTFVEVRQFVETKDMGAILSYYYGRFYGSEDYIRWSECRKTKSKKCVYGRRIFSGLRQQELLSRLLPTVSEECRNALLEVSKTFADEKMSLVDYVSSLKAMVGMKILVEAVGIGTGKQDLTGMALEPSKSNQVISLRHEVPTGKACSSLTASEIIKFLSGDYRLSKARSNDLFWEAVWPRLLARGWHSEQPKNQGYVAGSRHCLVFLMPGVKKFSRRKLVKGDHYFDSVTDVLSKVAKEPGLIELDTEGDGGNKNVEGYKWTREKKLEQDVDDDLPTRHRHCYLQPRTPNHYAHVMKFMVVDTSISEGAIRELRSLPSEISNMLISQDHTGDSDKDSSEETADESDTINTILCNVSMKDNVIGVRTTKSGRKMIRVMKDHEANASFQDTPAVYPDYGTKSVSNLKSKKDLQENKQSKNVLKSLLGQNRKQGNEDYVAPISKRCRRLPVRICEETSNGLIHTWTGPGLENGTTIGCSEIYEFTENICSQVKSCQDKLSSTISSKGSPSDGVECTRTLIDLNLPQVFPDFENDVFTTESCKESDNQPCNPNDNCLPTTSAFEAKYEQQSVVNPRRHSTRKRPPTTRALEALANGYLTVNKRRKGKDNSSHEELGFRPLQHARFVVAPAPNESTNSSMASQIQQIDGLSDSGNCNIFSNFQVLPEANEESVSGPCVGNMSS